MGSTILSLATLTTFSTSPKPTWDWMISWQWGVPMVTRHDGWIELPHPEIVCLWIPAAVDSNNGEGLLPSCSAWEASQEHLFGCCCCVIQNARLDGPSLVQTSWALLIFGVAKFTSGVLSSLPEQPERWWLRIYLFTLVFPTDLHGVYFLDATFVPTITLCWASNNGASQHWVGIVLLAFT